ncbi:MAG: hypothetical protein FIA95_01890, partial [Gemmatimonadetes bacterium]|nr:hypothetical protein [Gemmatimonadota bacterium]
MLPANRGALRDLLPFLALACSLASPPVPAAAQTARISEEVRSIRTYPFSEPNPIPILAKDARLYPYHTFDGYAADAEPR